MKDNNNDNMCNDADNNIKYYFLGLKEDLNKEHILKFFDTDYIPLNNLPISYYNTINPIANNDNDELLILLQKMNNKNNIYNSYNITPIYITVLILVIILSLLLLRIFFILYSSYYSYILIIIIIVPIIILSIWFLYINNQSL